jgi:PAS domain S-box-containing protein
MDLPRIAIDHVPEAISVHDVEGRYLWASTDFLELFGLDPHDLIGRQAYELFHPEDIPEIQVSHETITALPAIYAVQYRIQTADRTYRWVESISRLVEQHGVIVSATRPIDRRRSALDALEAERLLADRLREFTRQQEGFLTAISHRARNPVTIVHGLAELLARHWRELGEERVDELLGRLAANTTRLATLLSEVTQAEQLSRRARSVRARPVDVGRIARDEVETLAGPESPIQVDIPAGSLVFADPEMLRIALRVLIQNANQHTPAGTTVRVTAERSTQGTTVMVEDDGPGIPEPSRDVIFAAFHRGDENDHDPGLGLGLSTVAEIAAAHRGAVWVQDRDGGGASFRMLFPAASRATIERETSIDLTSTAVGWGDHPRALTIVAVDDDPAVLALMQMALQAEGHRVHTVANGLDALTEIFNRIPDLVILDVMMPGLDGPEVTRTLRSSPRVRHIPVLICSALTGETSRWDAQVAGSDGYLAKPFDIEELLAAIEQVTDPTRQRVNTDLPGEHPHTDE